MNRAENVIRFRADEWRKHVKLPVGRSNVFEGLDWCRIESEFYWKLFSEGEKSENRGGIKGGFSALHNSHGQINIDIDEHGRAVGVEFYDLLVKATE